MMQVVLCVEIVSEKLDYDLRRYDITTPRAAIIINEIV